MADATLFDKTEAAFARLDDLKPHLHWLPRLAFAGVFLFMGIEKLRGGIPPQGMLDAMFYGSTTVFWLVALGESFAGAAVLAGGAMKTNLGSVLTREAGLVGLIIMLGAITFHLGNLPADGHVWHFMRGGVQFQTVMAVLGLSFFLRGNQ